MSVITLKTGVRAVADLTPHPGNPKTHNDAQIEQIMSSIQRFGFKDPIGVLEDGTIVEGEGRWQAAQALGMEDVPVIVLEGMSERDADLYRIAHNKLTLVTGFDIEQLVETLRSVTGTDVTLDHMGFSGSAARNIVAAVSSVSGDNVEAGGSSKSAIDIIFDSELQREQWREFMGRVVAQASNQSASEVGALLEFVDGTGVLDTPVDGEDLLEVSNG